MAESPQKRPIEYVDTDLVRRVRSGDIAAFEALFARYQRRVYNQILPMVGGDESEAADLTQETFVRVYRSIGRLKADEAFFTWLRQVAVNIVRDHLRKKSLPTRSLDAPVGERDEEAATRDIEDWSDNPERLFEKREAQDEVRGAIGALSPSHREVVVLHHLEGMDLAEIARMLGVPVGTVKSRLARARDDLRRRLAGRLGF